MLTKLLEKELLPATLVRFKKVQFRRFNRLIILKLEGKDSNNFLYVLAVCDCGKTSVVRLSRVTNGYTKSCGCLSKEINLKSKQTHGMSYTTLYKLWATVKARTLYPHSKNWKYYGGKNVRMCQEWIESPEAFITWSLENGYEKGLQIDRINNDQGYSPLNCRYVTIQLNCRNRSTTKFCLFNNKKLTFTEADKLLQKHKGWISRVVKQNKLHLLPDNLTILQNSMGCTSCEGGE